MAILTTESGEFLLDESGDPLTDEAGAGFDLGGGAIEPPYPTVHSSPYSSPYQG